VWSDALDTIDVGTGDDQVSASGGAIFLGDGDDSFSGQSFAFPPSAAVPAFVSGGAGTDAIDGTSGNDFLDGGDGDDDRIQGGFGDDLFGGPGVRDVCLQGSVITPGWFAADASCEIVG
jgi:Ca2+-binding RTX toxin-like protein